MINLDILKDKSFEEGKEILENAGYVLGDSAKDYDAPSCDYILDTYFVLYDEDGEEADTKTYVQYCNENDDESNDDGAGDVIIKEFWDEV